MVKNVKNVEEIRFKPTSEELELLEAFKRRFNIKFNTQALRTLIKLSDQIKIEIRKITGDSLAEKTPKIKEGVKV